MKQVVTSSVVVGGSSRESAIESKGSISEVVSPDSLTAGPTLEGRPVLAKSFGAPLAELRPVPWSFLRGLVQSSFPAPADRQVLNEQIDRLSVTTGCWLTQQMWRGYSTERALPHLLRSFVPSPADPAKTLRKEAIFSQLVNSQEMADVRDLDRATMPGTLERLGITEDQLSSLNYRDRAWLSFFAVKGYFDQRSLTSLIERVAMIPDPAVRMERYLRIKYVISAPLEKLLQMGFLTMPQVQDLLHIYVANDFEFMPELCFDILKPAADRMRHQVDKERIDSLESLLSLIVGFPLVGRLNIR